MMWARRWATSWMSSKRTTVNFSEARPCLQELREERARPSGLFGPVDLAALARLAASCFSEMGFLPSVLCDSDSDIDISFALTLSIREGWSPKFSTADG